MLDGKRLIDSFARVHDYLRVSLTDRCDLGCFYCRPAGGFRPKRPEELLSAAELVHLADLFAGLGIRKVRLTGGEPLLRPDLLPLVDSLRRIEGLRTLGLTTNGTRLAALARPLREAGLDLINVSLDSLQAERFRRITGGNGPGRVLDGVRAAVEAGFEAVKLNMVVIRGVNDDEVVEFAALACCLPLTVRFIEYMPFRANPWQAEGFIAAEEIRERLARRFELTPQEPEDSPPGAVSRHWLLDGGRGRVGFISALSGHFCGSCSRLRLTADGALKLCLFSPAVVDLRGPLRRGLPDEELCGRIRDAMRLKAVEHPPAHELAGLEQRVMTQIGG